MCDSVGSRVCKGLSREGTDGEEHTLLEGSAREGIDLVQRVGGLPSRGGSSLPTNVAVEEAEAPEKRRFRMVWTVGMSMEIQSDFDFTNSLTLATQETWRI